MSERGLRWGAGARASAGVGGQPASEWEDAGARPRKAPVSHRSRAGQALSLRLPFTRSSSSSLVNKEPWPSSKALDLRRVSGLLFKATPRPFGQAAYARLLVKKCGGKVGVANLCDRLSQTTSDSSRTLAPFPSLWKNLQTPTAAAKSEQLVPESEGEERTVLGCCKIESGWLRGK